MGCSFLLPGPGSAPKSSGELKSEGVLSLSCWEVPAGSPWMPGWEWLRMRELEGMAGTLLLSGHRSWIHAVPEGCDTDTIPGTPWQQPRVPGSVGANPTGRGQGSGAAVRSGKSCATHRPGKGRNLGMKVELNLCWVEPCRAALLSSTVPLEKGLALPGREQDLRCDSIFSCTE